MVVATVSFERNPMTALLTSAEELARLGGWELDLATLRTRWTDGMFRIHGLEPGTIAPSVELLLACVHEEDRGRLAALIEDLVAHPDDVADEGVVDEYRVVWPDGSVRHIRFLGRIEDDFRLVGAGQDVTAERLAERELLAHYAVSLALREWESFEEGVVELLRRLSTALEYPMAALWLWDADGCALRCRAFWHRPDVDPGEFEAVVHTIEFPDDVGKPGLAWRRREPVLTADVAEDPQFRMRESALAAGVRSAVAFPAVGPDGPLAVLTFYGLDKHVPSASLQRTLTGIGGELGRFLARRSAQLGPRPLSDRELQVLTLAADGLSGPRIAERLCLSPSTVKTHLEHIYEKLGVGDRTAAVALAVRTGLVA